jgi:flagellin
MSSFSITNSYHNLNNLNRVNKSAQTSMQRLATGSKINGAKDDPAAYAILSRMNVNIGATSQRNDNVQNTNAMLRTTTTGSENIMSALDTIRSNLTELQNTATGDVSIASKNINNALASIDGTAGSTQYNGKNLLNGSATITMPSGQGYSQVNLPNLTTSGLGLTDSEGNSTFDLSSRDGVQSALDQVESAMNQVLDSQTTIGAIQQGLEYASDNYTVQEENLMASASTMGDTDMAKEITNLKSAQTQEQLATFAQKMYMHQSAAVLSLLR